MDSGGAENDTDSGAMHLLSFVVLVGMPEGEAIGKTKT